MVNNAPDYLTFNRVESARMLGIPSTTLANWAEELGISPMSQDSGARGVPALYHIADLFKAALAKTQLEGGLSKRVARVTAEVIGKVLSEAGVTTEGKPIGGLIGNEGHIFYVPREQWDDPAKMQANFAEQTGLFWVLDLRPVLEKFKASLWAAIDEKLGFALRGPAETGMYSIILPDGTKFESESFDSVLEQFRVYRRQNRGSEIAAALSRASRLRGINPDVLSDMEDLAQFVGYSDAQEFSEDIANVRKTMDECSTK